MCGAVFGFCGLFFFFCKHERLSGRTRKYRMFGTVCYKQIKIDTFVVSRQSCFMLKDDLCKESATSDFVQLFKRSQTSQTCLILAL